MTLVGNIKQAGDDLSVDYVQAINDCSNPFFASYRLWPQFVSYGLHFHPFYEILIHHRNGGRFVIGRDEYEMLPNTFFVVPPHQLHDIAGDCTLRNYERICIYASEEMLSTAGFGLVPILELINGASVSRHNGFPLSDEEYDEILTLTGKLHRRAAQDELTAMQELQDRMHATLILTVLCRVLEKTRQNTQKTHVNQLVMQVISYINDHYMNSITLDSLAQSLNVSKYYLSHEFGQAMGTSIYQYLLVCRINAAKKLILAGTPITDAAYQCGFNDYSSFLRAFGKIMGISPTVFRKRFMNLGET